MIPEIPLRWWAPVAVFVGTLAPTFAQPPAERPALRARGLETPPVIDGQVLEDPVWSGVDAATDFWQVEPLEGDASERTEVRIAFTEEHLYVGVVCFDTEPDRLVIGDTRRDSRLGESDSVRLIFDTFRDGQNGFLFGTNAAGIEYDAQITEQGGQRSRRGPPSGFNLDWNTAWQVEALVGDFGWSAEFAIPFRSLRYPGGREQIWGFNVERVIGRKLERSYWASMDRRWRISRVSEAGRLFGLAVPKQRNLNVTPYVLGSGRSVDEGDDSEVDFGVDVKYGVTPSLILDVTYNTDFAQVEADDQQVNLNRFNLFFPEKRPFFLENAGLFSVGSPGELQLFFSRRIGIQDGRQVPILGGARLSGRAAGLNVGFLNMQSEEARDEDGEVLPAANFSVARAVKELPNRSAVGVMAVHRQETGSSADGDARNTAYAVDGRWGIGRNLDLQAYAAGSSTPDIEDDEYAFSLSANYSSRRWRAGVGYTEVGEGFNPEAGFLSRTAYRRPSFFVQRTVRPKDKFGILEIRPRIFLVTFEDFDGFEETTFLSVGGDIEWQNGFQISASTGRNTEGVKEAFDLTDNVTIQPGTYEVTDSRVSIETTRARAISVRGTLRHGGFFNGERDGLNVDVLLRAGERLTSSIGWSVNELDFGSEVSSTNLGSLRATYSFTNNLFLEALIQYNDVADLVSSNLRFSWLQRSNTGLFVVYNDNRGIGAEGAPPDRSVIVKFSKFFDVFD